MIGLDVYKSKKELADWWGTDPVHMTPAGYSKIAESLAEKVDSLTPTRKEASRPQRDEVTRRVDPRLGISRSDTTASRWGRDEIRRSGYKGDKSRGHGGTATTVTDRTPKESFKKTTRGGSAHSFVQQ